MSRSPRERLAGAGRERPGRVVLVGAGPGDPELLTLRGLRRLRQAQVVVHDRLVHPALLDEAPAGARRIDVGKAPGRPGLGQRGIEALLVREARQGALVVRLKGGDPFVFARGGEEVAACLAAGVPCEVVPGVSSALAAPAAAGIPLTHRGLAASFAVVTARRAGGELPDWSAYAAVDTLVVLMGVACLQQVIGSLLATGRSPATPAALVERATLPDQRVLTAPLGRIAGFAGRIGAVAPATLVVGEAVSLAHELGAWITSSAAGATGREALVAASLPAATTRRNLVETTTWGGLHHG